MPAAVAQKIMRRSEGPEAYAPGPSYSASNPNNDHRDLSMLRAGGQLWGEVANKTGRHLITPADQLLFYRTLGLGLSYPMNPQKGGQELAYLGRVVRQDGWQLWPQGCHRY